MKIGVLIYTYNRTDDARINMEIIRDVWSKNENLKDVKMVHSFNGEKELWPEKYLEDDLLYLDNPGHFEGAEVLINAGVKTFQDKYSDIDYVIVLASDTWLVKPEYLESKILSMKKEGKYIATSVWGDQKRTNIWSKGFSLDLLVFDLSWATKSSLFPIRFREFKEKYEELFFYNDLTVFLEVVFALRFKQAISRSTKIPSDNILSPIAESYIHRIKEREPIHYAKDGFLFKKPNSIRKMYWPNMGLITHHQPETKQKALKQWNLNLREYGNKFLNSKDMSYFNNGLDKNVYIKNDKKIGYGD